MTPYQRIIAIRLAEKINRNPAYAEKLGITVSNKKNNNGGK